MSGIYSKKEPSVFAEGFFVEQKSKIRRKGGGKSTKHSSLLKVESLKKE
ncbi:hypothetical protein Aconfl_02770 [Algoriphagus confluentis]|uniref:Uncharacterized protein n=1 Tax=Algoriphagus confluentis TaxID=1697556 RepID=A0ABQ6PI88_9BACT|nr:hypothetical protein Aconfl_02770 [Algoriphagus confluentis]